MLVGLVTDSVLHCFCRSCKAPPGQKWALSPIAKKPKNKPRTKQPKKVKFVATEIRCKEESKGGLKFDVIIADPAATPPKRPASPPTKTSAEEIEEKLKAAEERRLSLEANKMAKFAAKLSKIEEASKKKDEQNSVFINQTKEALEQKMETHIEKREAYLTDIKAKLKDHLEGVEKSRQVFEQQTQEVRNAVEEKLKTAAAQRDENIKKMLEKLKEHSKMESAANRRIQMENEQREKLRQLVSILNFKLDSAGTNREKEIEKKLEIVRKNEKRAEIVRQNKERLSQVE
uniref:Uncharacterized protein n=1 Tax=Rhodnius prolixus TaxID=13249 RepID=T1HWZ9_RHOPR